MTKKGQDLPQSLFCVQVPESSTAIPTRPMKYCQRSIPIETTLSEDSTVSFTLDGGKFFVGEMAVRKGKTDARKVANKEICPCHSTVKRAA